MTLTMIWDDYTRTTVHDVCSVNGGQSGQLLVMTNDNTVLTYPKPAQWALVAG